MGFYQKLQKNTPDEPELCAQGVSVASFTNSFCTPALQKAALHPNFTPCLGTSSVPQG